MFFINGNSLTSSTTLKFYLDSCIACIFFPLYSLLLYISTAPSGKRISFLLFHKGWFIPWTSLLLLENELAKLNNFFTSESSLFRISQAFSDYRVNMVPV